MRARNRLRTSPAVPVKSSTSSSFQSHLLPPQRGNTILTFQFVIIAYFYHLCMHPKNTGDFDGHVGMIHKDPTKDLLSLLTTHFPTTFFSITSNSSFPLLYSLSR